mgnify:CR=1 FL=1
MIPRYFVVAEASHELQNPTSREKLVLLGQRLELGQESRVLDIASGRGGPALVLAQTYGCSVRGVEISPDFHAVAEAFVEGQWRVVDGTLLAPRQTLVRIATGRDAADTAFLDNHNGAINLNNLVVTAVVDGDLPVDSIDQLVSIG